MFFLLHSIVNFIRYVYNILFELLLRIYVFIPYIIIIVSLFTDTKKEVFYVTNIKGYFRYIVSHHSKVLDPHFKYIRTEKLEVILGQISDNFFYFILCLTFLLFVLVGYLLIFSIFFFPTSFFVERFITIRNILPVSIVLLVIIFFFKYFILILITIKSLLFYIVPMKSTGLPIIYLTFNEFSTCFDTQILVKLKQCIYMLINNTCYLSVNLWCVLFLGHGFKFHLLNNYVIVFTNLRDFFLSFYCIHIVKDELNLNLLKLDEINYFFCLSIIFIFIIIILDRYMNRIIFYEYVYYLRSYYNNLIFRKFLLQQTFCILNEESNLNFEQLFDVYNNIVGENALSFFEYKLKCKYKYVLPHIYIYLLGILIFKIVNITTIKPIKLLTAKLLYYALEK